MGHYFFTSESVTEGHPDKLCDCISDAILDNLLAQDENSRVACETTATTGLVVVMGEITTKGYADIRNIVRDTIREIGYTNGVCGFNAETCGVMVSIGNQSEDIRDGVDNSLEEREGLEKDEKDRLGAGDQGMMFGYACTETEEYMPLAISLAHRLARRLTEVRKSGLLTYLRPDGKTQVTVEYDENRRPVHIDTVVISTQHAEDVANETIERDLIREVIGTVLPKDLYDDRTKCYINPSGRFVKGGPEGDTGLTGRKIVVDTYGGYAPHGGGAFSGKDYTKVDRSAAYAARHAAKHLVAAGLAERCTIQLSYAIGMAHPMNIYVDSEGTGVLPDDVLTEILKETFDFRPAAIIQDLNLKRPIYRQTAAYGHFGRTDDSLPWEVLDRVEDLKEAARRHGA